MFWKKNKKFLTDAHCHLLDYENLNDVEFNTFCVTTRPEQFLEARKLQQNNSLIRAGLGLFPLFIKDEKKDLELFEKYFENTNLIGEVGLDFTVEEDLRTSQIRIFKRILDLAESKENCVLSLHSRRSSEKIIEMIKGRKSKFIFHWYSGSINFVKEAQKNIYFSLNPAMVRSRSGKEILRQVSLDQILLESDAPYVKMEQDEYGTELCTRVVEALAQQRGKKMDEILLKSYDNFLKLFPPYQK